MVSLKYLSNFWTNLKMPLINCENNLFLTSPAYCFLKDDHANNQGILFELTDRKLHVPVATLSTKDSAKILLIEIKIWNKDQLKKNQWKATIQERNRYLDYLINSSFQEVNRLFVLSFENTTSGTSY